MSGFWNGEGELRRREFLERSAYAAGLAGLASVLPAKLLLAEAARAQAAPLPSPSNMPIDHFVVICMENRSFDHYFGWLGDLADATQSATYPDHENGSGEPVSTVHASDMGQAQWQGCGHPDPGHGWNSGRKQLEGGFLADGSGNDIFALTYYNEGELGFIHDAAKLFTVYDGFHCSALTSTWPNRYFEWSAQAGGRKDNSPPIQTLGNRWETIFDRALGSGVSARYYNSDLPFSAVWGARAIPWTNPLPRFFADCAAGTLPNISFVDPPFRDGGGFDGNSADEHPHGDVRLGQAWMADVVNAFVASPNFRRGALFVVYDEWGGFFDHVTPPKAPDDRASANLYEDWGQMGFRIPAVCVSPFTLNRSGAAARVGHGTFGFESILKLISYRFGLGTLRLDDPSKPAGTPNKRHETAANIGETFDWSIDPDAVEIPELPDPAHIASRPCELGGGDLTEESAEAHISDLADLADFADGLGFKVGDSKPHDLFRQPDSVRKALRAGDALTRG
jgi:phospholipase C